MIKYSKKSNTREDVVDLITKVKKYFDLNIDEYQIELMGTQVNKSYRSAIVTPTSFFQGGDYSSPEQLRFIRSYKQFLENFYSQFIIEYNISIQNTYIQKDLKLPKDISCNAVDLMTIASILLLDVFINDNQQTMDIQKYMYVQVYDKIKKWMKLINLRSEFY